MFLKIWILSKKLSKNAWKILKTSSLESRRRIIQIWSQVCNNKFFFTNSYACYWFKSLWNTSTKVSKNILKAKVVCWSFNSKTTIFWPKEETRSTKTSQFYSFLSSSISYSIKELKICFNLGNLSTRFSLYSFLNISLILARSNYSMRIIIMSVENYE